MRNRNFFHALVVCVAAVFFSAALLSPARGAESLEKIQKMLFITTLS